MEMCYITWIYRKSRNTRPTGTAEAVVIGVAAVAGNSGQADSIMGKISRFVEENTEAVILDEEREIR